MQASTSSTIRQLIGRLARGTSGSKFEEAARRFNALPLDEGWFGWFLLTDQGEVVEESEEGALSAVPEPLRTICLVAGAEKYPELIAFLPVRPPAGVECERCHGTGWMELGGEGAKIRCGDCRALGWVDGAPDRT